MRRIVMFNRVSADGYFAAPEPGNDIMIFGSGSVVSQLTEHRLIDEYQFIVSPTLLGDGRSGNIKLRYAPRPDGK